MGTHSFSAKQPDGGKRVLPCPIRRRARLRADLICQYFTTVASRKDCFPSERYHGTDRVVEGESKSSIRCERRNRQRGTHLRYPLPEPYRHTVSVCVLSRRRPGISGFGRRA